MKKKKVTSMLLSATLALSLIAPTTVSASDISETRKSLVADQSMDATEQTETEAPAVSVPEETDHHAVAADNTDETVTTTNENLESEEDAGVLQQAEQAVGDIYLDTTSGNDNQDGTSASPVKTLEKALEKVSEGGTIVLTGTVDQTAQIVITQDTVIDKNVKILRGENCKPAMFSVRGGTLTIKHATVDSNSQAGAIKVEAGGNVILDEGSKICNTSQYGLWICNNASVTMNDGEISDNNSENSSGAGIYVEAGAAFTMNGGTLARNTAFYSGGAIYTEGTVTINGGTFIGNTANGYGGGAIFAFDADVTIEDAATFTDNRATGDNTEANSGGGAIALSGTSSLTIGRSVFSNNQSQYGGAIAQWSTGTTTLNGTTLFDNQVLSDSGGAISISNGTLQLNGAALERNQAFYGGGISAYGSADVQVNANTRIRGNIVTDDGGGGGIAVLGDANLTVEEASITENESGYGGGIASWTTGTVTINGASILNNQALSQSGGGISITNIGDLIVHNATFQGNQATYGGGISAYGQSSVQISDSTVIRDNTVSDIGGAGLYGSESARLTVGDGVQIENNTATDGYGGGIFIDDNASLTIGQATIDGNSARCGGGISVTASEAVTLNGTVISNNQASTMSGGGIAVNNSGIVTINKAAIINNQAPYGGGISASGTAKVDVNDRTSVTKNTSTSYGGGISAIESATINLNSSTISENQAASGSAVSLEDTGTVVMKDDVSITKNKINASNDTSVGGTVYISGYQYSDDQTNPNTESNFVMEGGTIRDNTVSTKGIHCAGIYVAGRAATGSAQIKGGTLSNNTNANGDDQSIVVEANSDGQGNEYLGKLKLGGTPTITGQILLKKDTSANIKIEADHTFKPKTPLLISLTDNKWTNHTVIATYENGATPDASMFKPYNATSQQLIVANGQNIECMNKVHISLKNVSGDTDLYVMPEASLNEKDIPTFTKKGYTLAGWYTDDKLQTKWDFSSPVKDDMVLYAKWTPVTYRIYYALNGGEAVDNPKSYTISTPTITLKNPTRKNYIFAGWYSDSNFKTKVTTLPKGSTGVRKYYAKWIRVYKIYYALNGGGAVDNPKSYTFSTPTITLKNPTRKGYLFAGWYSDSNFKTKATKIPKGSTGIRKYYAKWTRVNTPRVQTVSLSNSSSKKLTIKFTKVSGAKGYQICYALDKNFTEGRRSATLGGQERVLTVAKNKTYYVKVRAYKLDSQQNRVYSSWSNVKSIKINK